MKNEIWTDFNAEQVLALLNNKLGDITELCDSINDHCEQILDDVDLLNTMRLVREIKEYCEAIRQITETLRKGHSDD